MLVQGAMICRVHHTQAKIFFVEFWFSTIRFLCKIKKENTFTICNFLIRCTLPWQNWHFILLSENTKEILDYQFFPFFATFYSCLIHLKGIDLLVWSMRFFWYPCWHSLWHFMSYGKCQKCHKMTFLTFYDTCHMT